MILQFQHQQYAWGDTFYVMDEDNKKKYQVRSSVLLWNKKFEIRDMDKNVLVTIKNEPKSLVKKKFYIFLGDQKVATITKEISLTARFTIEGLDWQMRGVMLHSYEMLENGREVLSMNSEYTKWGEQTVLRIADPANELLALAVAMTITYVTNAREDGESTHHL